MFYKSSSSNLTEVIVQNAQSVSRMHRQVLGRPTNYPPNPLSPVNGQPLNFSNPQRQSYM